MRNKLKILGLILLFVALGVILALLVDGKSIPILDPQGMIAQKQKDLLIVATLLMLIVVIPVFIMTFAIAWKYRESNKHAKYSPDWDHDRYRIAESIWWGVPLAIIVALSIIIVQSSHELDPYKALESTEKPVTIQVVALQWRWLFIYPEHDIATVNFIQFPQNTPVNFQLTSDAPMNSFWIPSLGGQVYAMSGMTTKLHLIANEVGDFKGSSANISGEGFSDMKFTARASSEKDFDAWVASIKSMNRHLDLDTYNKLSAPSDDTAPQYYSSRQSDLYDTIVMKYMEPGHMDKPAEHEEHNH